MEKIWLINYVIYIFFSCYTFFADQFSTAQVTCATSGGTTMAAGRDGAGARDAVQFTPAARAHGACHVDGVTFRHVPAIARYTFSS